MKLRPVAALAAFVVLAASVLAASRDAQWKKVDDAVDQRLPKTALEQLQPIIAGALADHRYAEATKAIARRVALETEIEGGKPEEAIRRLEAEIAKAPAEMKAPLEAIAAHWYWSYFQRNRWRFHQRTATVPSPGADLTTWDLPRILAEIDRHFQAALASDAFLKKTPIAEFNDLVDPGTVPDAYRPTLYDFFAFDALAFYQAGEQGAVTAEDAFELDVDTPIFGSAEEFLRWQPAGGDAASPLRKAIALYQDLLRFHEHDRDRSAFLDADLARLTFAFNAAAGESKNTRYEAALQRFIDATAQHEISARALALLAAQANNAGDPARAHALAKRGFEAFPGSAGGASCFNLLQQLELESASLATEFVWNAPWPTLDVTYRNVTHVYFRAVPVDFSDHLALARWNIGGFESQEATRLLDARPALEWDATLPATADYRARTESLPAPTTLKPGFYAILASHRADFASPDNQLSIVPVWVSDLALVFRSRFDRDSHDGFLLKGASGEPVAGATIQTWLQQNDGKFQRDAIVKTDADGHFSVRKAKRNLVLTAEAGGQQISSNEVLYQYGSSDRLDRSEQTRFFTDRAIYRPGQSIQYKGISYLTDRTNADYRVLPRTRVEVVLDDPNGKEIARATHVTNDYGSFSGAFTAPRDRLLGNLTLRVVAGPGGGTSLRVEEYKRPKFEVTIPAPAEAAKLGASVDLIGKATAYTGAAIGGAKVAWRVERGVRLPSWCWWWQPPSVQAIAHGTAVTDADGTFRVQFIAAPDRTVPEKLEPVFAYTIHADITDTTGETRSAERTIAAGYTALQAELSADDWQTPGRDVAVTVRTTSLDGDPQAAAGTLTIRALKQPAQVVRSSLQRRDSWWRAEEPPADPTNPESWETESAATATQAVKTDASGQATVKVSLPAGIYRASLETKDRFGKIVTSRHTIEVVDPASPHYAVKVPHRLAASEWKVEPGEKFSALWGTGYPTGRAFVELECAGRPLQSFWTAADRTQQRFELPVTEAMRGGVSLRVTYVRDNRAYLETRVIDVPWSNRELSVKWESFRSKLEPGQKETWTATITGPDAERRAVEMVATLYDASLDAFRPHSWATFGGFRTESNRVNARFANSTQMFTIFNSGWNRDWQSVDWAYRSFPEDVLPVEIGIRLEAFAVSASGGRPVPMALAKQAGEARVMAEAAPAAPPPGGLNQIAADKAAQADASSAILPPPNLDQVTARKNLNETAFFFPQLLADEHGVVKLQFTMPEALTRWKFLGLAHDQDLRSGLLAGEAVTSKDLMVEPNPPRFVREGDEIEFTVKVSNQTDRPRSGSVRLTFADAATLANVDAQLGNRNPGQKFEVPAKQSRTYSWRVAIPDGLGFLTYKAVGATNDAAAGSDGEEGFLPVLSRRVLVTESLPLPIRGPATKEFSFAKLLASGQSPTLRHQTLTVQMVSQPAWYAVLALPYLMEYPYECSEQIFNRLYANALARHIAGSDPKIRRVFELWKNTPTLDSPLVKNQDLKSVLIEETPWLRDATKESEGRRNVGVLFDANRLDSETARTLQQLAERQQGDGLWSWFPGGQTSEYISMYIVTGFGRLRHLGVQLDDAAAAKALAGLDEWMGGRYREIQRQPHPEDYVPDATVALYLYGRSFFLPEHPLGARQEVADFFLQQARKFWTKVGDRQSEAHLALALQRFGDTATPAAIAKSLKERSVTSEELGRFWRDTESSWWWYHAPIETQAMMIEVFAEVAHDAAAVDECQVWLLKQKQTQDWRTTKATADAVYALLLRGKNLLASDALVEVSLAGTPIRPENVEAGTGFYEKKFVRDEIKPELGRITVKKTDAGVSWGSATWQYLEDMSRVTPHEGTPLTLKKALFVKETTKQGPVLKPVTGPIEVGDELVVRLELRTDRDMEFVHLKDQRGSGTEPVNVLSQYQYQDGLGYYESTRDTASHFFIDYLPKGTYVFEYSTRVQLKGRYQTGIAEIQCMYAPEFNSHSESIPIEVK